MEFQRPRQKKKKTQTHNQMSTVQTLSIGKYTYTMVFTQIRIFHHTPF